MRSLPSGTLIQSAQMTSEMESPHHITPEELALGDILAECVDAIEQGETDLNALAGRYPQARQEIEPLLQVAWRLWQKSPLNPEGSALGRLRRLLV